MKVTIENKKGLSKDIKVIIDKKTMDSYLENQLGVDVNKFNKSMEDMTKKIETNMIKNKLVED